MSGAAGSEGSATEVRFQHSPSFPEVLERAACSLLVSTYQAGQLAEAHAANTEWLDKYGTKAPAAMTRIF